MKTLCFAQYIVILITRTHQTATITMADYRFCFCTAESTHFISFRRKWLSFTPLLHSVNNQVLHHNQVILPHLLSKQSLLFSHVESPLCSVYFLCSVEEYVVIAWGVYIAHYLPGVHTTEFSVISSFACKRRSFSLTFAFLDEMLSCKSPDVYLFCCKCARLMQSSTILFNTL